MAHAIEEKRFEQFGATSHAALLMQRLHVNGPEAHTRVRRAQQAAPRTTLTGEALPPRYEQLSRAQADGSISGGHLDVLNRWLGRIEPHTTLEQFGAVETALVTTAEAASPDAVAALGREILHEVDPDGREPRDLERRRGVTLKQNEDGSGRISGTLMPELLAKLLTIISPLAAPRPTNPQTGEKDPRGAAARRHDAMEDIADRVLRSGDMPAHGGTPLTLVVMMDIDDLIRRTGTARTAFGTTIPIQRLLEQAAEMQIVPVITSKVDGIIAYGQNRRIASPGQALALIGRDRGCTFPGCGRPAQWCQRHHIAEVVADDGNTDLDNLVLVCGWHHRNFTRLGWTVMLKDGHAWWTPPTTVDPDRRPMRNLAHDPPDLRRTA